MFFLSGDGELAHAKWEAVMSHMTNQHDGFSNPRFPACEHGPLEEDRVWLEPGKALGVFPFVINPC